MRSHPDHQARSRLYNGTMTSTAHAVDLDPLDEQVRSGDAADPAAEAREIARILASSKLAYVAIGTARGPLVTPVLYGTVGGAIWVLTNRRALKTRVWSMRPRTGWTVRTGETAVAFTGEATLFSLNEAKSVLARPLGLVAVPPAVLSWACRNPRQVAGFAWDTIAHPSRGMPQDFVLVRLQPDSATLVRDLATTDAAATTVDTVLDGRIPTDLVQLAGRPVGVLGLTTEDGPVAIPVGWDAASCVARVPVEMAVAIADGTDACITFDEPVHLRPTEQRGIVLRGSARNITGGLRLAPTRVTYWDGFATGTVDLGD